MTLQTGDSWCKVSCQVPRSNVCRGLWQSAAFITQIAKNRITIVRIATYRSMNFRADCHKLDLTSASWAQNLAIRSPLESGLPRSYSCCCNPQHFTAEHGKWPNSSTRHFTSTVPLFVTSKNFVFGGMIINYLFTPYSTGGRASGTPQIILKSNQNCYFQKIYLK
jgi:hypothetical protein